MTNGIKIEQRMSLEIRQPDVLSVGRNTGVYHNNRSYFIHGTVTNKRFTYSLTDK